MVLQLLTVLLTIQMSALALFLSPVVVILFSVRLAVKFCAKIFRPDLDKIVSGVDAIFAIKDTSYPVGCCLVFGIVEGGGLNLQVFRDMFQNRILELEKDNRVLYKRLEQFWTDFLGFAFWKTDPFFDLKNHVRDFDYDGEMALPSPCTEVDLVQLAGQFQNLEWPEDRSPWEILLISDFLSSNLQKRSILLFRLDHVLMDGYGFINLTRDLFLHPCEVPKCKLNVETKLSPLRSLTLPFKILHEYAKYRLEARRTGRLHINRKEGSTVCALTEPISMDAVKSIKNRFNVSFSTVIHAALAGAVQRALTEVNEEVPESLNFAFPIPKPSHPDGLANDVYLGQGAFPIQVKEHAERLALIQQSTDTNTSSKLLATDVTIYLAGILPTALRTRLKSHLNQHVSVSMSNLPSAANGITYNSTHLTDLHVFVPGGNYGIVSILAGVSGHVRLGLTIYSPAHESFGRKVARYVKEEVERMGNSDWKNNGQPAYFA